MNVTSVTGLTGVTGRGAPELDMSAEELRAIVAEALSSVPAGARVLAVIPDKTRDDNTDVLFPAALETLRARGVEKFDALVAQGTHAAMTDAEKRAKAGLLCARKSAQPRDREGAVLVHERDDVGDRRQRDQVEVATRDL